MKCRLGVLLGLMLGAVSALADWGPMMLKELIQWSDCIVVAEFVAEESHTEKNHRVDQQAKLKVLSTLKGPAPEIIRVVGTMDPGLCKAQYVFANTPGAKYLLFLRKDKAGHTVCNGPFGALEMTGEEVKWFSDEDKMRGGAQARLTPLKTVEAEIRQALQAAPPR